MDKELLEQKWRQCMSIVSDNIPAPSFDMWFANITPLKFENQKLTVRVPSHFFVEHIESNYIDLLHPAICRVFGQDTDLMYSVLTDSTNQLTVEQESDNAPVAMPTARSSAKLATVSSPIPTAPQDLDSMLRPAYNFNTFVEGTNNKLARAVGDSIAVTPGHNAFNPLFVYGASGVGKTHLINAIGLKVKELYPEKRVLYISAHLFKVQFMNAVQKNTLPDFINFYQTIDVLIIDDIQEFIGNVKTQNAFFHIFNHLQQTGRQLVMSCDRHPSTLQGIEDRLITRFKWGLVAEIELPDFALRKAILLNKVQHDGISISEEVIDYIADNVTDSVRELEGILHSIVAHSTILNREPSVALAERIIDKAIHRAPRVVTIDSIIKTVTDCFHVTEEEIYSTSRKREIVQARQVTMYLSQKHVKDITYDIIGKQFNKDHSTVIHSCNLVKSQLEVNSKFRASVEEMEAAITRR